MAPAWSTRLKILVDSMFGGEKDVAERRRIIRLRSRTPITCVDGGQMLTGVVINASSGGMSLELSRPVTPKKRVVVSLATPSGHTQTITCEVRWCRTNEKLNSYTTGMRYAADDHACRAWLTGLLRGEVSKQEATRRQRRKKVRIDTELPVLLRTPINPHIQIKGVILSLSMSGALMQVEKEIRIGTPLVAEVGPHATLPAFNVTGSVVGHKVDEDTGATLHRVIITPARQWDRRLLSAYIRAMLST